MMNLKYIINNSEKLKYKLKIRGFNNVNKINIILKLAKSRSILMTKIQKLNFKKNLISKKIGILKNKNLDVKDLLKEVSDIKIDIDKIQQDELNVNKNLNDKLLYLPNIPLDDVPIGKDENENVVIKEYIIGRKNIQNVEPHYEYGVKKGFIDFDKAIKLSGSRFWLYKGEGAKLLRALQSFMLDENIKRGYLEIIPPLIVKKNIMQGTGQLPKFEKDIFKLENKESYLIPTSEVPLTNLYANEIIDLKKPKMFTSFTPCFRSEAGAGGKDSKGLIRAHQFYKVELVKITNKNDLESEYKKTLDDCKNILNKLELSYREIIICTGDLGFASEKTIDLEVWIPSENKYKEVSSISSFGDFQGRRAKIRYKDDNSQNQYACTINASALAIDRIIASILEIYQNNDGTLTIPKVLVPYFGKEII